MPPLLRSFPLNSRLARGFGALVSSHAPTPSLPLPTCLAATPTPLVVRYLGARVVGVAGLGLGGRVFQPLAVGSSCSSCLLCR